MEEKKEKKKGIVLKEILYVIIILLVVSVAKVKGAEFADKIFTKNDEKKSTIVSTVEQTKTYSAGGLSITLPSHYIQIFDDLGDFTGACDSEDSSVLWDHESFDLIVNAGFDPEDFTVEDYISLLAQTAPNSSALQYDNGLPYITYESNGLGYCATVYKGSDAFWVVNQVCPNEFISVFLPAFLERAHTVYVR